MINYLCILTDLDELVDEGPDLLRICKLGGPCLILLQAEYHFSGQSPVAIIHYSTKKYQLENLFRKRDV